MGIVEGGLTALLIKGALLTAGALQGAQELGAKTPAPTDVLGKGKAQQGPARTAELEKGKEKVQQRAQQQVEQATQQITAESQGNPAVGEQAAQQKGLEIKRKAEREYAVLQGKAAKGREPGPLMRGGDAARSGLPGSQGSSRATGGRLAGTALDAGARAGTGAVVTALTDRGRDRPPPLPSLTPPVTPGGMAARRRVPARSRTILSSPLGISSAPNTARRTLLGQ